MKACTAHTDMHTNKHIYTCSNQAQTETTLDRDTNNSENAHTFLCTHAYWYFHKQSCLYSLLARLQGEKKKNTRCLEMHNVMFLDIKSWAVIMGAENYALFVLCFLVRIWWQTKSLQIIIFFYLIPGHNNLLDPSSLPTHKHTQYTSTATPSFYCGFTSLKRCLGSLGIAIVILGHVLYFLLQSDWSRQPLISMRMWK